jgi:hypothetical protein
LPSQQAQCLQVLRSINRDQKPASEVLAQAVREASVAAYERGLNDALKTNPPSMDLEMVCVNLWTNKQPVLHD